MSLPTGVWKTNVDGLEGLMNIVAVDGAGQVTGNIQIGGNGGTFVGLWDDTSRRVSFFAQVLPVEAPASPEYFEGYLMTTPHDPPPGQDTVTTLAGFVQSVGQDSLLARRTNARRSRFAWSAEFTQVA